MVENKWWEINGVNVALWLSQEKKSEKAQVDIFSLKSSTEEILYTQAIAQKSGKCDTWYVR